MGVGGEGVCGGSRSRGRTHPPDTHTLSPPTGAQRPLLFFFFFCPAPTTIRTPPPQVSPATAAAPILRGPPRTPAPLPKPGSGCLPGPPVGCRGYNGAAEKRDLTFHGGRGGDPPSASGDPLLSPCSSPLGEDEDSGVPGGDFPAGGGEPPSPPVARPLRAPSPNPSREVPGRNRASASWGRMDGEGGHWVSPSPLPLNNERS